MDLYHIDLLATSGQSWLHRVPAGWKLLAVAGNIALILAVPRPALYGGLLLLALLFAMSARLPLRTVSVLTAYPLIFLAILFLSTEELTLLAVVTLVLRVLAITASVIMLLLTTSYPALFSALGLVLPAGFVAALFFTYRALFILSVSLANTRTALHLRGGMGMRRPLTSFQNLGTALGHVLVHAIDMSQRMAESLTVRGFRNRIYTVGERDAG